MSNFWDSISLNTDEEIHHLQIPESEATIDGKRLFIHKKYLFRCRCWGPARAIEIATQYAYERLYWDQELTGDDKIVKNLSIIPINFSARCEDEGFAHLWGVSFDLISFGEAMNDPDFAYYYNFSGSSYSRESTVDKDGVPIIHQYQYSLNHPRKAGEIIPATGTVQKDIALFTFTKNLIKEMKYPETAAGFISYVNSIPWDGYPARVLKITNVTIRSIGTNYDRDDYDKNIYCCTFEIQANEDGWDQFSCITDPETGQYPGDLVYTIVDGKPVYETQPGLDYPPAKTVEVLREFDFHRLWPDVDDETDFQERGAIEFPLPT